MDGGGVLIPAKPDDYSLVIKGKNGFVRIFNNIITFPVRTENSQRHPKPAESPTTAQRVGGGTGCTVIAVSVVVAAALAVIMW